MEKVRKSQKLAELENLIRTGAMAAAAQVISGINRAQIPREELALYANLANRVNMGRVAHRLLQPVIRSEREAEKPATDVEKIEYAEALRIMGLIEEAKQVLSEVDLKAQPLADMRIAFCLMSQWKYAEAMPHLRSYLSKVSSKDYSGVIARVNLAAALVIERQDDEALQLLEALRAETRQAGHQLLYGNCLELLTQLFVVQRRFERAEEILQEAEPTIFAAARTRYSLYMQKWKAILNSMKRGCADEDLWKVREMAVEDSEWETIRECDLYIGYLNKDRDLLTLVYFGTPHPSYRKRVLDLAGGIFQVPSDFIWNQNRNIPVSQIFNLVEGRFESTRGQLERGRLMHRLLLLLARDFYRPVSVASAFSELFPEEHYSQQGSANRVVQIVKRLRAWFRDNGEGFFIEERDGSYRLKIQPGFALRQVLELPPASSNFLNWEKLALEISAEIFSKSDVCRILDCSPASANRLLRWALSANQCEALGAGRQRKYRLIR